VDLVAGIRAGLGGELLDDPQVLREATLTATFGEQSHPLSGSGESGRYTAQVTFRDAGDVPVVLHLKSPLVDRTVEALVKVAGRFHAVGSVPEIDFGTLTAGETACRPLALPVEREGEVPLVLTDLRPIPAGHRLEVRLPAGSLTSGGEALRSAAEDPLEICLVTERRAPSFQAAGEPWLELGLAGSEDPAQRLALSLRWQVTALSFWQLWGRWILALLGGLVLAFGIGGFAWPQRLQRSLAVTFVPDLDELDEQSAQPVAQWRGVGIGFYRHARAFLHPDFRLSGKSQGALASLHAERGAIRVRPGRGITIFRQTLDGEWEAVAPQGRRVRPGDVYRLREQGPYARISFQGARR
jgi:hypothetical protein